MIWIIIGSVAAALVLILVTIVLVARRRGKNTVKKLDENLSKLQTEKEEMTKKEQADAEEKKEKEAFKNITLTDDVEDEFKDIFTQPLQSAPQEDDFDLDLPDFGKNDFSKKKGNEFDDDFFKGFDLKEPQPKKLTRDEEFEEFLNEHSFSRRVLDRSILDEIKTLSPKMKALVLGNVFSKFDKES